METSPDSTVPVGPRMNPWLSIWLRPRATMRSILDTDPERLVILLACVGGVAEALGRASMRNVGDRLPLWTLLLTCGAVGPVGGLISLYLGSLLLRWTGGWIGGRGTRCTSAPRSRGRR